MTTASADQNSSFDIVIGGGGAAGLTMARALSATMGPGLRLALIDKAPLHTPQNPANNETSTDPRAFALSSGTKRMLDVLGIWDQLSGHAQPVTSIEITDSSLKNTIRPPVLSYDNHVEDGEPASFILEAARLDKALLQAAHNDPAITLIGATTVTDYRADETGITLTTKLGNDDGDGSKDIRAALLIAADGRQSKLRQLAGIKTVDWDHGQIGIVAIIAHTKPHQGQAVQHFLPGGPFAILPLPGDRSCVTWSEDAATAKTILALDEPDFLQPGFLQPGFLQELRQRFSTRLGEISLITPPRSWPLTTSLARSYIAHRLVLIGDAAHGVHPIAGQGLNLAMRDVAALSEVLVDSARLGIDLGGGEALERYERWRRFDATTSAMAFSSLNKLFSNDWTLGRTLRDAGLGLVDRLPGLKRQFVEEAAGLTGDVPRLLKGELV